MQYKVVYQGKTYVYTGKGWYGESDFMVPSQEIQNHLQSMIAGELADEDASIEDPEALLSRARKVREQVGQTRRALGLAQRALEKRPYDAPTIAVISSILRDLGRSREALELIEPVKRNPYAPLQTTRAAALCDIREWEEAFTIIRRVIARSGGRAGPEALNVRQRIKKNRPDLFDS